MVVQLLFMHVLYLLMNNAIEKEAYAVVEALGKLRHLLIGKHFTLLTDQKSESFMLDV